MAIEIYCVKCKAKTDSSNVESVTMKNGRPGDQGRVRGVRRRQVPYWCDASGDELSQARPTHLRPVPFLLVNSSHRRSATKFSKATTTSTVMLVRPSRAITLAGGEGRQGRSSGGAWCPPPPDRRRRPGPPDCRGWDYV